MKYELTGDDQVVHRGESRQHLAFVPGHLVVNVKADAFLPYLEEAQVTGSLRAFPEKLSAPLRYLQSEKGMRRASAIAGTPAPPGSTQSAMVEALATSAVTTDSAELQGLMVIDVAETRDVQHLARELQDAGAFEFVEPFPARWPAAVKGTFRRLAPVDPERNVQWHLRAIDWFAAARPDCQGITVAVMDSGIDELHPQLKAAIASYEHFGWKAADLLGHGTHVAGIIAGRRRHDVPAIGMTNSRLAIWKTAEEQLLHLGRFRAAEAQVHDLSAGGLDRT